MPLGAVPPGGWPVVVLLHGGWWRSVFGLSYCGFACAALRAAGVAVWSVEYRRVGNPGGGWPGTFEDVAAAMAFLPRIAAERRLNLGRVVAAGHSAGGHLAFWLAGMRHVPAGTAIRARASGVRLRGVVALAGCVGLGLTIDLAGEGLFAHDSREVERFMGGSPTEVPERYRAGDPASLLPLGVPQMLIQGSADAQIPPELPGRWAQLAGRAGDRVSVAIVPGAGTLMWSIRRAGPGRW